MYIDPNTGGMLFQILAVMFGLISGMILFFSGQIRMAFKRIKRAMRQRAGDDEKQTDQPENETAE